MSEKSELHKSFVKMSGGKTRTFSVELPDEAAKMIADSVGGYPKVEPFLQDMLYEHIQNMLRIEREGLTYKDLPAPKLDDGVSDDIEGADKIFDFSHVTKPLKIYRLATTKAFRDGFNQLAIARSMSNAAFMRNAIFCAAVRPDVLHNPHVSELEKRYKNARANFFEIDVKIPVPGSNIFNFSDDSNGLTSASSISISGFEELFKGVEALGRQNSLGMAETMRRSVFAVAVFPKLIVNKKAALLEDAYDRNKSKRRDGLWDDAGPLPSKPI